VKLDRCNYLIKYKMEEKKETFEQKLKTLEQKMKKLKPLIKKSNKTESEKAELESFFGEGVEIEEYRKMLLKKFDQYRNKK
jgi:hypothetical protein